MHNILVVWLGTITLCTILIQSSSNLIGCSVRIYIILFWFMEEFINNRRLGTITLCTILIQSSSNLIGCSVRIYIILFWFMEEFINNRRFGTITLCTILIQSSSNLIGCSVRIYIILFWFISFEMWPWEILFLFWYPLHVHHCLQ